MNYRVDISVRPFKAADRRFLLSLVPRFTEFSLPTWRDPERTDTANKEHLEKALTAPDKDEEFLIAEDAQGTRLGFIRLQTSRDYFTGEETGYIADMAVSKEAEGKGAGAALMAAAEEWSRQKGHRLLTLYTFSDNQRAIRFYEKSGFREELKKYVKAL